MVCDKPAHHVGKQGPRLQQKHDNLDQTNLHQERDQRPLELLCSSGVFEKLQVNIHVGPRGQQAHLSIQGPTHQAPQTHTHTPIK